MKKLAITGSVIVLLLVAVLWVGQRSKPPSDAEIRQNVVGAWYPVSSAGVASSPVTLEMKPDGIFVSKQTIGKDVIAVEGRWSTEDGVLVLRATNAVGADRYRVVRIGGEEMILRLDGEVLTNFYTMKRRL